MNARGTRRPHQRRVRFKPVKIRRGGKSSGCLLLVLALAALPVAVWAVAR